MKIHKTDRSYHEGVSSVTKCGKIEAQVNEEREPTCVRCIKILIKEYE